MNAYTQGFFRLPHSQEGIHANPLLLGGAFVEQNTLNRHLIRAYFFLYYLIICLLL